MTLIQDIASTPAEPLLINVLRIDPKVPGVRICAELAQDVVLTDDATKGREAIGSLAARHGAVAAVNADYFPFTGDPLGLTIRNNELLSEPMPNRATIGFTTGGAVRINTLLAVGALTAPDGSICGISGINRPLNKNEIILLTPAFGNRIRLANNGVQVVLPKVDTPLRPGKEYSAVISDIQPGDPNGQIPATGAVLTASSEGADWIKSHLKPGDTLKYRIDLVANPLPPGQARGDLASRAASLRGRVDKSEWDDVEQAVGGGPWLVRDGKITVDGVEEGFPAADFINKRHPRTAVGVTSTGEILLVTVDGRRSNSKGFTLPQMAAYMLSIGAVNAMNLDGGGSTSLVTTGGYANMPSDGEPRAVADALVVYAPIQPVTEAVEAPVTLHAGDKVTLTGPKGPDGQPLPDPIWGTLEGVGLVTMDGVFSATKATNVTVIATTPTARLRVPITVVAGPPAKLSASITAAPNNPPDRNTVTVRVLDEYGNAVVGETVELSATHGVMDQTSIVTDKAGRVQTEVVWDSDKGRVVNVRCGKLTPVTLKGK